MLGKKKEHLVQEQEKKSTPAFLREDYLYQSFGEPVTDLEMLEDCAVYEIKCHQCEMSIRSQGQNIKTTYTRLKTSGCIGCGNKDLVIRKVDMSKAPQDNNE